jgi:uncharacterized protein (TIGR03435 family)
MRRLIASVVLLLTAALVVVRAHAQTSKAATAAPSFEVASVKPSKSGINAPGVFRFLPDGSLHAENMPLRDVIRVAYRLRSYQMANWPTWTASEYFDIQAKADGNASEEQRLLMLRHLLATRFKLAVRTETHNGPGYDLVIDGKDGHLGPHLMKSVADCAALRAKLPPRPLAPAPNAPLILCGIRNLPGRVFALGVPIETLSNTLVDVVGRPVLNHTQLNGNFDVELTYRPDPMPAPQAIPPDSQPIDPNGPSIFTAVREQLGLKLEFRRNPFDVFVIEHIERPTPD